MDEKNEIEEKMDEEYQSRKKRNKRFKIKDTKKLIKIEKFKIIQRKKKK